MNITVVGIGYVGLSVATLLAQKHSVVALDIDEEKVARVNQKISPIEDKEIEEYLRNKELDLKATTDSQLALKNAKYVIIATPTNYDVEKDEFDTRSIESTIEKIIRINPNLSIVIKSTIPIGYIDSIRTKYNLGTKIFFAPEFLREGKALYDNLYPSRIVVGSKEDNAREFATLLENCAIKKDIPLLFTASREAEAIKLFANTYLALRVSFFNELDTFAEEKGMDAKAIIDGICYDFRIGTEYNNPSFGYGGYCLPKDTKQLLSNYKGVSQNLITAVVDSNVTRKEHIAQAIYNIVLEKKLKTVGIYRLVMKANSDNFRESAIQDVIISLKEKNVNILIYEPMCKDDTYLDCSVTKELDDFKSQADIIVANRIEECLTDCKKKIYTRDIFGLN